MFDSVLVLDRTHASRLARAELATLVVGAHVAALAAILAAQTWRIETVPLPRLPASPLDLALPIVFAEEPSPASRPQPARAPAAPTVAQPAPAPPAATPDQLAAAEVPALSRAPTATAGTGVYGAPVDGGAGERSTSGGDGAPIHYEGSGLTRPTILLRVDPVYPPVARIQHKNGMVIVRAEIATDGSVRGAEVVEAAPHGYGFEQSALDAVRQWRFRPATTADGRAVAVLYRLQVTFTVR